jgi:hypothetical protein
MQRAGQVRRQFSLAEGEASAVARICRLVEGLPLAIELAAAALRTRSCAAIADAIETSLSALATSLRAIPERHRSMWAAFEHSWRLLSEQERQVFAQLSVFRGGFEEEAAALVAQSSPQILAALVDKSLLRWDGAARYDMHELVRQYAGNKLEEQRKSEEIRKQHARYFLGLAEIAEPKLLSSERAGWLEQLEREHDNLRAALAWSQETTDASGNGLRLAGALAWFWMYRNYISEGRAWADGVLAAASAIFHPRARGKALYSAGLLAWVQDDYAVAEARLVESVRCCRETGEQRGLALALSVLGMIACDRLDYSSGHNMCAESVAISRELRDSCSLALGLYFLGNAVFKRGDNATARPIYEESLALWRTLGDSWGLAAASYRLGMIAYKQGNYPVARLLLEEALANRRAIGQKWVIAISLSGLAEVALCEEQYHQATRFLAESLLLYQELGARAGVIETLEQFALLAVRQAQLKRSARLWAAARAANDVRGAGETLDDRLGNEQRAAVIRAQLGEATFAAIWAEGHAMTVEQAIAYALDESKSPAEI